ncbi:MAG: ribonuclease III [Clostridia bacterium]|nr:ribonuclease III [Clostridia bacterium]
MKTTTNSERFISLTKFCKNAGITIKNISLLDQAFYHRSVSNEKKGNILNNERLEFLGDSVLGLVTASYLFSNFPDLKEGELAKIKSVVVSEKILAPNAIRLGINNLLVLGHGEEITGGRTKPAILADCMEAVIGAYFIDSGFDSARDFVLSFIVPEINKVLENGTKDYKTLLQEFTQKKYKLCPVYELLDTSGPEHEKVFTVLVSVGNQKFGPVKGTSKKISEQLVAEIAYKALN